MHLKKLINIYHVKQSNKLLGAFFQLSALVRLRVPTPAELARMVLHVARSSLFLAYNAFGFPATICAIRSVSQRGTS